MSDRPDFAGVPLDIEQMVAAHRAQYAEAEARGAAVERVQERLTDIGASVTSPRGEVTVRVASSGLLEDVRIGQRGLDLGAAGLSRLLTTTLRQALVQLEENAAEAITASDAGDIGEAMLAEIRAGVAGPVSALDADGTDIRLG